MTHPAAASLTTLFAHHPRRWERFRHVYPVISRRAGGLSVGINLNPDKACNFHCVYCSVDRAAPHDEGDVTHAVDLAALRDELRDMLALATTGELFAHPPFDATPPEMRRVRDLAFSGDGEPTTFAHFDEAVRLAADAKREAGLAEAKLVLITNGTVLERDAVKRGLRLLDENRGEVWAKLDAGTEAYYRLVDRSKVPLATVLRNIRDCGRERELVIQTMLLTIRGEPMSDAEFDAYLGRLAELRHEGCRIREVHLYTVARATAEAWAAPLERSALERFAVKALGRLPQLPVRVFAADG